MTQPICGASVLSKLGLTWLLEGHTPGLCANLLTMHSLSLGCLFGWQPLPCSPHGSHLGKALTINDLDAHMLPGGPRPCIHQHDAFARTSNRVLRWTSDERLGGNALLLFCSGVCSSLWNLRFVIIMVPPRSGQSLPLISHASNWQVITVLTFILSLAPPHRFDSCSWEKAEWCSNWLCGASHLHHLTSLLSWSFWWSPNIPMVSPMPLTFHTLFEPFLVQHMWISLLASLHHSAPYWWVLGTLIAQIMGAAVVFPHCLTIQFISKRLLSRDLAYLAAEWSFSPCPLSHCLLHSGFCPDFPFVLCWPSVPSAGALSPKCMRMTSRDSKLTSED